MPFHDFLKRKVDLMTLTFISLEGHESIGL
jgi:hypothetical protein